MIAMRLLGDCYVAMKLLGDRYEVTGCPLCGYWVTAVYVRNVLGFSPVLRLLQSEILLQTLLKSFG